MMTISPFYRKLLPALLAALTLSAVLSGCEKDLDLGKYRNPEIADMLVVNSLTNPDSTIRVSVTHPYFFSDTYTGFKPVTGLTVEISDENGEVSPLTFDMASGMYVSENKPAPGEVLNLSVSDGKRLATVCDTVPHTVEISDVAVNVTGPIHTYYQNDYIFTYKISFQDTPGEENFYFLSIENNAGPGDSYQYGIFDYTADYVFQTLADMINRSVQGWKPDGEYGYPFSDKGIDGKRYTVTVKETVFNPLIDNVKKLPRKINLYSISKPYFEYMVSVLSMDFDETALMGNLLSLGLMEPTKIYSNITGGTGLMGSYNLSTRRIDLLQLCGGWPQK